MSFTYLTGCRDTDNILINHADENTIHALSQVNSHLYFMCHSEKLWKTRVLQKFQSIENFKDPHMSWYDFWILLKRVIKVTCQDDMFKKSSKLIYTPFRGESIVPLPENFNPELLFRIGNFQLVKYIDMTISSEYFLNIFYKSRSIMIERDDLDTFKLVKYMNFYTYKYCVSAAICHYSPNILKFLITMNGLSNFWKFYFNVIVNNKIKINIRMLKLLFYWSLRKDERSGTDIKRSELKVFNKINKYYLNKNALIWAKFEYRMK